MLGHLLVGYAPAVGLAVVVMIGLLLRAKQKRAG
jgi:hypothetical protein